jgi:hypothetical protein
LGINLENIGHHRCQKTEIFYQFMAANPPCDQLIESAFNVIAVLFSGLIPP